MTTKCNYCGYICCFWKHPDACKHVCVYLFFFSGLILKENVNLKIFRIRKPALGLALRHFKATTWKTFLKKCLTDYTKGRILLTCQRDST